MSSLQFSAFKPNNLFPGYKYHSYQAEHISILPRNGATRYQACITI